MLLAELNKVRPEKSPEEHECILQAEPFINSLSDKNLELLENYIERFKDWLTE